MSTNKNSDVIETTQLPPAPGASSSPRNITKAFSRDYQQRIKIGTNHVTNQYRAVGYNTKK